jgi:hypothetical protein
MNLLKNTNLKRLILIFVSLVLSGAAIWSFKDTLITNFFGNKSIASTHLFSVVVLIGISGLLGWAIIYNLLDYLFPDNLVAWLVSCVKQRKIIISSPWKDADYLTSQNSHRTLLYALVAAYLAIFLLVFSEWIFLVTKESFMDSLPVTEKLSILIQTTWIPAIIILVMIVIVWILSKLLKYPLIQLVTISIYSLIPAIIVAITAVLVFDNFTYNILGIGIVDTYSIFRAIYGLAFLLFINKTFIKIQFPDHQKPLPIKWKFFAVMAIAFFTVGTISTLAGIVTKTSRSAEQSLVPPVRTPNIILIGSDGVTADNLSIYGYGRNTTPFINSIADQALIAEANFPQTGSSLGSLISIFTSKLPTRTGVVNMPDGLIGDDSNEHLPGLLKDIGYTNVDITYDLYSNVSLANIRNGFDRINGVEVNTNPLVIRLGKILPVNSEYNIELLSKRITDRLQHILFIRFMTNPFEEVTMQPGRKDATARIPELMSSVQNEAEPFFIHVHLLGTHGPMYRISSTTFSQGRKQKKDFDIDFYDDAIVDFDTYIHDLFTALEETGKLKNTIVIIYSDHPRARAAYQHTPLLLWFPDGQYAGQITSNTQNMDIAPTILDYLGEPIPDWMEGESLLKGNPSPERPIYSVLWKDPKKNKLPNQTLLKFSDLRMIICNQYVEFSSEDMQWHSGEVDDKTSACAADQQPSIEKMKEILLERLQQDGVDTTLLEESR